MAQRGLLCFDIMIKEPRMKRKQNYSLGKPFYLKPKCARSMYVTNLLDPVATYISGGIRYSSTKARNGMLKWNHFGACAIPVSY